MIRLASAALATAAALAPPAAWVRVESRPVVVLSDASAPQAQAVALRLRVVDSVVRALFPGESRPALPEVVVLALRDAGSFAPFRPVHGGRAVDADGVAHAGGDVSYIAVNLAADGAERHEVVDHEYAHLLLSRMLAAQPPWAAEGLADLVADAEPRPGGFLLGRGRPGHLALLRRRGLLPLRVLLAVDYASPDYNGGDRRTLFYAQSWALVHMLAVRFPSGTERLAAAMADVRSGLTAAESLERRFEDLDALQTRLAGHVAAGAEGSLFLAAEGAADGTAESAPADEGEVAAHQGALLLHAGRLSEAASRLERALQLAPGRLEARTALAEVRRRQERWSEARLELQAAADRWPRDPKALYQLALGLQREALARERVLDGEDEEAAVAALEEAIRLAPTYAEACDMLARLRPRPLALRIAQMEAARRASPARSELGFTLAWLHGRRGDWERAARVLVETRETTKEEAYRFLASHLLGKLAWHGARTRQVAGRLRAVDCPPDGSLVFRVEAEGRTLAFRAGSPRAVMIQDEDGDPVERDFVCGPQDEAVRATYRAGAGEGGELLTLSFPSGPSSSLDLTSSTSTTRAAANR